MEFRIVIVGRKKVKVLSVAPETCVSVKKSEIWGKREDVPQNGNMSIGYKFPKSCRRKSQERY